MPRTWETMHGGTPDGGVPWAEMSLSFVRTVAAIAAGEGRDLLWGNDDVGWSGWLYYFLMAE